MPAAARVTDISTHGGTIIGPGVATVLIGGLPASIMADTHICSIPPNTPHLTVSPIMAGSTTVLIGGRSAARVGDMCICGASAAIGCPTVIIGG